MNARVIAWAAIGLWIVTVVVVAVLFVRGQTTPSTDGRLDIRLAPAERDIVLKEMRGLLESVQGIVAGVSDQGRAKIVAAARASGAAAAADVEPALMLKLPLEFKQLGMSVHGGFDAIAARAEAGAPDDEILKMLATQLASCVGCHATYRLTTAPAESATP